jgi:hypothetical protein
MEGGNGRKKEGVKKGSDLGREREKGEFFFKELNILNNLMYRLTEPNMSAFLTLQGTGK